jgi:hypothetical protein
MLDLPIYIFAIIFWIRRMVKIAWKSRLRQIFWYGGSSYQEIHLRIHLWTDSGGHWMLSFFGHWLLSLSQFISSHTTLSNLTSRTILFMSVNQALTVLFWSARTHQLIGGELVSGDSAMSRKTYSYRKYLVIANWIVLRIWRGYDDARFPYLGLV